jgi:hypothetical protein
MMITAAHNAHNTTPDRVLCTAFELSEKTEKPGFTTAMSNASRTHHGGT